MSAAEEAFRAGRLAASLDELQKEIRSKPADGKLRIFLSQLLMISGDWDRALNQLSVVRELDASAIPMAQAYSAAVQCERLRKAVFAGERSPLVFGEPQAWIAQLLQALALEGKGHAAEAGEMRASALEAAPATPGTMNGDAFEWIADADSRIGPILETLLNGSYYWIPFDRISRIAFEQPTDIRDLAWLPAQFTWTNGGEAVGLVPVRYSGSEDAAEDAVRLARRTEWRDLGNGGFAGLGQRVLASSAAELGLLEVREITLAAG